MASNNRIRLAGVIAVVLGGGAPGVASACLPPAAQPSPQEREAQLRTGQAVGWAKAALVYEAEITETFTVMGGPDSRPGYEMGTYVRTRPIQVLKGEGAPTELMFAYDVGPECTFGPSYSPRARGVGGRFVFYSVKLAVETPADVFYTLPVDAVIDADTQAALRAAAPTS